MKDRGIITASRELAEETIKDHDYQASISITTTEIDSSDVHDNNDSNANPWIEDIDDQVLLLCTDEFQFDDGTWFDQ